MGRRIRPSRVIASLTFLAPLAATVHLLLRIRRIRAEQATEQDKAVAQAREEFTRDLHDLVGHWLWMASVKSELAYRRAAGDTRLCEDLAEAVQAVRHAAHAVRTASRPHRDLSLHDEALRVEALLWSLGLDCMVNVDAAGLPPHLGAALGAVVREGVTNMLRHSEAGKCVIEAVRHEGRLRLTVANDGVCGPVRPPAGGPAHARGGLENLRRRMAAVGGTSWAETGEDGWFRLVAEVPVDRSE
ncbi:hypothetical protein HS041_24995 [Planomonospora sp. ID67723]|uniref:sensor histidine kinase n=1 Tax=Planomonospora sp. ID67723 TaxID=2738134 RepID=UPI0018C4141F|nr:histidine kinase [Planomonospora sp. ID67723]MBG0831021.1 hypothetical protein [Planomonospora sp. ID67723]